MADNLQFAPSQGTPGNPSNKVASPGQVTQMLMDEAARRGLGWFQPFHAAGITGSLMQETGDFRSDVINFQVRGDSGSAHGLMQWRGNRYRNLLNFAQQNGLNPADIRTQVSFLFEELNPSSPYKDDMARRTLQAMQSASNVADAAAAFVHAERPAGYDGNPYNAHDIDRRIQQANQAAAQFTNGEYDPYQGGSNSASDFSGFGVNSGMGTTAPRNDFSNTQSEQLIRMMGQMGIPTLSVPSVPSAVGQQQAQPQPVPGQNSNLGSQFGFSMPSYEPPKYDPNPLYGTDNSGMPRTGANGFDSFGMPVPQPVQPLTFGSNYGNNNVGGNTPLNFGVNYG